MLGTPIQHGKKDADGNKGAEDGVEKEGKLALFFFRISAASASVASRLTDI